MYLKYFRKNNGETVKELFKFQNQHYGNNSKGKF